MVTNSRIWYWEVAQILRAVFGRITYICIILVIRWIRGSSHLIWSQWGRSCCSGHGPSCLAAGERVQWLR
jgi:hypothetical protein